MLATSQWILAGCVTSDLRTSSPRYRQVLAWPTTHPAERLGGLDMASASGQCAPQEWRGGHQTANLVLDPRRPSLTEFLTEYDSAPGGPQDTRRTGSTRFCDVSSTGGPQGAPDGRSAADYGSGGWGFESLAARHVIAGQPVCLREPTLVLIIFGPIWSALVDDQEEQASAAEQPVIGRFAWDDETPCASSDRAPQPAAVSMR
jgi:hypothetical protein